MTRSHPNGNRMRAVHQMIEAMTQVCDVPVQTRAPWNNCKIVCKQFHCEDRKYSIKSV
jgi:hypothetical protein